MSANLRGLLALLAMLAGAAGFGQQRWGVVFDSYRGYDSIWSAQPTPEGGLLVGGFSEGPFVGRVTVGSAWAAKVSPGGRVLWDKHFAIGQVYQVAPADNGWSLLAADKLLLLLDGQGEVVWAKRPSGQNVSAMLSLPGNRFLLAANDTLAELDLDGQVRRAWRVSLEGQQLVVTELGRFPGGSVALLLAERGTGRQYLASLTAEGSLAFAAALPAGSGCWGLGLSAEAGAIPVFRCRGSFAHEGGDPCWIGVFSHQGALLRGLELSLNYPHWDPDPMVPYVWSAALQPGGELELFGALPSGDRLDVSLYMALDASDTPLAAWANPGSLDAVGALDEAGNLVTFGEDITTTISTVATWVEKIAQLSRPRFFTEDLEVTVRQAAFETPAAALTLVPTTLALEEAEKPSASSGWTEAFVFGDLPLGEKPDLAVQGEILERLENRHWLVEVELQALGPVPAERVFSVFQVEFRSKAGAVVAVEPSQGQCVVDPMWGSAEVYCQLGDIRPGAPATLVVELSDPGGRPRKLSAEARGLLPENRWENNTFDRFLRPPRHHLRRSR